MVTPGSTTCVGAFKVACQVSVTVRAEGVPNPSVMLVAWPVVLRT